MGISWGIDRAMITEPARCAMGGAVSGHCGGLILRASGAIAATQGRVGRLPSCAGAAIRAHGALTRQFLG
ncbi:hypothetical protein Pstr01_42340 [Pseudomonas straminea]|nr:hypothetical protein Pstr01_42340 [Pseudomonas straminea]